MKFMKLAKTTFVRFCLSYDSLECDFIFGFKINFIFIYKCIVDKDVVSDITHLRQTVIAGVVI